ncbi:MAG TPA: hypothetical protein VLM85_08650 [Polyangiaceae bacterium]|nr:hypothetical protein [Polyangiaceae bacterium]
MNTQKFSKSMTGPDCVEPSSSRVGWAAFVALSGLVVASAGCSQAQAAESQDQQLSATSPSTLASDVHHIGAIAGIYYERTIWNKDASGNDVLPSPNDDAVMLGSDGSLNGFNGTQNAVAFPLFPTNSAGTLGSWRAVGNGKIEIKFFRMLTAPQGWIGNPSTPTSEYFSDGSPLLPTQFFGYVAGHVDGTLQGGVITGTVHIDTFSNIAIFCDKLDGVLGNASPAVPCKVRSADGNLTMTAFDPAKGPPASVFAVPSPL